MTFLVQCGKIKHRGYYFRQKATFFVRLHFARAEGSFNMKKIQILLSTYNGEHFLREQLDSFLRLEGFDNVTVLIRDDGSTDSTRDILREYSEKYGFEIILGDNVGLNASMMELILCRDRECSYFAFSDQDDVWLPPKLERAISALDVTDPNIPTLYAARSTLVNEELSPIGETIYPKRPLTFYNAMVQNVCAGHAQVVNSALAELISHGSAEGISVFDHYVYTLAGGVGNIVFDYDCTTLYRQHGANVIGYDTGSRLSRIKHRFHRAIKTRIGEQMTCQLSAIVNSFSEKLDGHCLKEAKRFLGKQKNFFTRLGYIFTAKAYRQTTLECLVFKTMYLFGKYKIRIKRSTHK